MKKFPVLKKILWAIMITIIVACIIALLPLIIIGIMILIYVFTRDDNPGPNQDYEEEYATNGMVYCNNSIESDRESEVLN